MKKQLGKKEQRTAKTLQLYANFCNPCNVSCGCSGCASVPSSDYMNVKNGNYTRTYSTLMSIQVEK